MDTKTRYGGQFAPAETALLDALSCALNGGTPDPGDADLREVMRLAQNHSVAALAASALARTGKPGPWKEIEAAAVRRRMLFDAERREILAFLERSGIWYLPLKGVILQDMYPGFGLREMSDNDILFDPAGREALDKFMLARGYTRIKDGALHHFGYHKLPVYNFEMHYRLFAFRNGETIAHYYERYDKHLLPDGSSQYGRHLSNEDFYLFLLAHAWKHFCGGGIGLRTLVDIRVYTGTVPLDREYLRRELEKMDLSAFEETLRWLSEAAFSREPTSEEAAQLSRMLSSGLGESREARIEKRIQKTRQAGDGKHLRARYLYERFFQNIEDIAITHPFVYRHRMLYPFFCVVRLCGHAIQHPRRLAEELRYLWRRTK